MQACESESRRGVCDFKFGHVSRKESYASILFFTLYRARYEVRVTSYKVLRLMTFDI